MNRFFELVNQGVAPIKYSFNPTQPGEDNSQDPIITAYNNYFATITDTVMTKDGTGYYIQGMIVKDPIRWGQFVDARVWRMIPLQKTFQQWCNENNLCWKLDKINGSYSIHVWNCVSPDPQSNIQQVPQA
jgi:hypothetical protein